MSWPAVPRDAPLRVVGDVHGDARAFSFAAATDRFVIQLGDLTDYGPDSAEALRIMFRLIEAGRGAFVLGNHDHKLARVLAGHSVHITPVLAETLRQLDPELRDRARVELARAPSWIKLGDVVFVHAGFHTEMVDPLGPAIGAERPSGPISRALFGEPTGRIQSDGYPERSLRWVDRIPPGLTVYCGHDNRSFDGRPYQLTGAAGGRAVFLDTAAGKGGHLSWIDLH